MGLGAVGAMAPAPLSFKTWGAGTKTGPGRPPPPVVQMVTSESGLLLSAVAVRMTATRGYPQGPKRDQIETMDVALWMSFIEYHSRHRSRLMNLALYICCTTLGGGCDLSKKLAPHLGGGGAFRANAQGCWCRTFLLP